MPGIRENALDILCTLAALSNHCKDLNVNNVKSLRCYKSQRIRESTRLYLRQKFKGCTNLIYFKTYTSYTLKPQAIFMTTIKELNKKIEGLTKEVKDKEL